MSLLSYFYGDDENAQRAANADAQLRALNAERAKSLGSDWLAQVDRNYASQSTFGVDAQNREIDAAFDEGWNDGKENISGAVSGFFKVIGDGLSAVLLAFPAWVWLIAVGGVFFYLGGFTWLRGILAKK